MVVIRDMLVPMNAIIYMVDIIPAEYASSVVSARKRFNTDFSPEHSSSITCRSILQSTLPD